MWLYNIGNNIASILCCDYNRWGNNFTRIAMYITIEILITNLSPLFSAIYDHIIVEGNAIN